MWLDEEELRRARETIEIPRQPEIGPRRQLGAYRRAILPRRTTEGQFVVFAQGRSGSALLGELLGTHPKVAFEDEILSKPVRFPLAYATGLRARHPEHVYGFHLKSYQLTVQHRVKDVRRWLARLVGRGWTLIYLERRNVLRQAISGGLATVSGVYHHRAGDRREEGVQLEVEPLIAAMRLRAHIQEEDRQAIADLPHESVNYERDLLDQSRHQATADRLFSALGLDRVTVSTDLRRMSSHPSRDVGNWPAVREAVLATPMADLVREVEPGLLD